MNGRVREALRDIGKQFGGNHDASLFFYQSRNRILHGPIKIRCLQHHMIFRSVNIHTGKDGKRGVCSSSLGDH